MSSTLTLKDQAYQKLKKLILSGELGSEDLTERNLVNKLGMSRTPIRSALQRLEVEGLLSYTPNKGLAIAELSLDKVIDFYDFRIALESYVVKKLAIRKFSNEEIMELQKNLDSQKECVDSNNLSLFTDLDFSFHRKLMEIYNNKEILQTMDNLHDKLYHIALKVLKKSPPRISVSYQDHLKIFELISNGKSDKASEIAIQHLESGKHILIS